VAKKEAEWISNAFSRITALERENRELREELNIVLLNFEKIELKFDKMNERPSGKLEAVQPGPDKAAERRREQEKKKRDQVLPG